MRTIRTLLGIICCTSLLAAAGATAQPSDYYQGKTLTVIVGYAPGGGVDATARAVTRHFARFIPGRPNIVVQNMEGAAGVISANHLAQRVAPDGLTIGVPGRSWFLEGVVKRPGIAFDLATLTYIGSPGSVTSAAYVRAALGIRSFEALKASKKTLTFGALGPGTHTATVPLMLAAAGVPVKPVLGYVSTTRILLALEQGEVDGSFTTGDGIASRKDLAAMLVPLVQTAPRYPGLPLVQDVIRPGDRPLLDLVMAPDTAGVMIVGPPKMNAEATAILRRAFMAMAADKDYQADAEKVALPVGDPIEGGKLAEFVRTLSASTTPEVIAAFRAMSSGK